MPFLYWLHIDYLPNVSLEKVELSQIQNGYVLVCKTYI